MKLSVIGVDLAKDIIQVRTSMPNGKTNVNKALKRSQFIEFMAQQPCSLVGMEACGSSHYWARQLKVLGHTVKLMHPAHVKPFVMGQKNDKNDADACSIAVAQPDMRFVPIKNVEQQDIQMVLKIKERLEKQQTGLVNQIRGLLREYGFTMPQGIEKVFTLLPIALENSENMLTPYSLKLFQLMSKELHDNRDDIQTIEKEIKALCDSNPLSIRLIKAISGIGPMTALTLVKDINQGEGFSNGRHLSAWIGLVPRQHSSGGKTKLGGISKRGSSSLRRLLFMGARSVIRASKNKDDKYSLWVKSVVARLPHKKAAIAVANKMARMSWAVLNKSLAEAA